MSQINPDVRGIGVTAFGVERADPRFTVDRHCPFQREFERPVSSKVKDRKKRQQKKKTLLPPPNDSDSRTFVIIILESHISGLEPTSHLDKSLYDPL